MIKGYELTNPDAMFKLLGLFMRKGTEVDFKDDFFAPFILTNVSGNSRERTIWFNYYDYAFVYQGHCLIVRYNYNYALNGSYVPMYLVSLGDVEKFLEDYSLEEVKNAKNI